jgi:hypothetical protein
VGDAVDFGGELLPLGFHWYRLPAKFYVILWMMLWLGAVGCLVSGVLEGLEMARDEWKGSGPLSSPIR